MNEKRTDCQQRPVTEIVGNSWKLFFDTSVGDTVKDGMALHCNSAHVQLFLYCYLSFLIYVFLKFLLSFRLYFRFVHLYLKSKKIGQKALGFLKSFLKIDQVDERRRLGGQ